MSQKTPEYVEVCRNRVRPLRLRLDMRQSDLANDVGVTRQTILAIEKMRLNPSVKIALRIARVLREPVDYVFYFEKVPRGTNGSHRRPKGRPKYATS